MPNDPEDTMNKLAAVKLGHFRKTTREFQRAADKALGELAKAQTSRQRGAGMSGTVAVYDAMKAVRQRFNDEFDAILDRIDEAIRQFKS